MSAFLQYIFGGLTSGCVYALAALGLTLIFNASRVVNFAQGAFLMLGGMITSVLIASGVPLVVAVICSIAITVAVGAAVYTFAIAPARNADSVSLIIITIGVSIFIEGMTGLIFDKNQHLVPSFSGDEPIRIAGASLLPQSLWMFAVSIAVVLGISWFFRKTLAGKAMRAVSINRDAASLVGIKPERYLMVAFSISACLGAIAGAVSAPITTTVYDIGLMIGLKGFVGATLGGLGSATGAVVGGLIIGLSESMVAGYVSTAYKDAVPFLLIIAVLLFMPEGIFGSKVRDRV